MFNHCVAQLNGPLLFHHYIPISGERKWIQHDWYESQNLWKIENPATSFCFKGIFTILLDVTSFGKAKGSPRAIIRNLSFCATHFSIVTSFRTFAECICSWMDGEEETGIWPTYNSHSPSRRFVRLLSQPCCLFGDGQWDQGVSNDKNTWIKL